jgi:hypothetical protein
MGYKSNGFTEDEETFIIKMTKKDIKSHAFMGN